MASAHTAHRGRVPNAPRFDQERSTQASDLLFDCIAWRDRVRALQDSLCPAISRVPPGRIPVGLRGVERSTLIRFLWLWALPLGPWRTEGALGRICERMDIPRHASHPWGGLITKMYEVGGNFFLHLMLCF